jgi:hypothetical protein
MSGHGVSRFASYLPQARTPVVVTFDGDTVVDVFGDLEYFTGAQDRDGLLGLLRDLLVGQDDAAPLLRAVELAPGKYADVHVVPEGHLRHLVLLDASTGVLEARELQQMKNEAALVNRRPVRTPGARDADQAGGARRQRAPGQSLRQRLDVLENLAADARARLDALAGHAGILGPYCAGHPEAARALAHIRRTAVQLEARLLNCAGYLRGSRASVEEPRSSEPIPLRQVAAELERLFGAGEGHQLSVNVASDAGMGTAVDMDYARVRQLLITLVTVALDTATEPGVFVRLDSPGGDLLVAIDAHVDWAGESWDLDACHRLVRAMNGHIDIDADAGRPELSHVRILLPQPAASGAP